MNRKKITTFILLSYGISWLIWLPRVLDHQLDLGWHISPWNHIAGGLGPFFGALLTTFLFDGRQGLNRYLREKLLTAPTSQWLLIGWGMPVTFFVLPLLILGLVQGTWADLSALGLNTKIPLTNPFLIWLLWCFFYGLGEEGGWRGFLFPELARKFKARTAALLVALVWAPWHLPLFFFDKDLSTMGVGGTIGWAVGLAFGALLMGWLVKQSRWNLWPVILWHGTFNFFTTSDQLDPLFPAIMSMLVILVTIWAGRRYGANLER